MKQGILNGRHGNVTVCPPKADGAMAERFTASEARFSRWYAGPDTLGTAPRDPVGSGTRRSAPVDPADLAPVKAADETIGEPFGKTDLV